ncbi:MAG: SxtJ family membrane protein [Desulfosudaceae bacterium]
MEKEKAKDAGLALVLILLLAAWGLAGSQHPLVAAAAIALVVCLVAPKMFTPLAVCWYGLSDVLGAVVSRFVLALIYLLVVVPVGVTRRAFGADPLLRRRWKKNDGSVFVERDHTYTQADIDHPF